MRRICCFLVLSLLLSAGAPALAAGPFQYESERLGFSLTVPSLPVADIVVEESETGVAFFHRPSQALWGGLLGTIQVVSPRGDFFQAQYRTPAYQVLAMGKDRIFLWKSPGGGMNAGGEALAGFAKAAQVLTPENLRKCLTPAEADSWPALSTAQHRPYLPVESNALRPNAPLTRGELAEMLFALLDAANKADAGESRFSDIPGGADGQAVNYLASYGILSGYGDGTFRPERPISRAAFAALLHRCQFAAPVGRYGDQPESSDVPDTHWAKDYIDSAAVLGWMTGDADGRFRPEDPITRAAAVTAINRVLGRDATHRAVEPGQPVFGDLDASHWAYKNLLEAAGLLATTALPPVEAGPVSLPGDIAVSQRFFFNSRDGLALGHGEDTAFALLQTRDGGKTWTDFFENPTHCAAHLPADRFPTQQSLLGAVVSAQLRFATPDTVELTVWYRPYESIYATDFVAAWQTSIGTEDLR